MTGRAQEGAYCAELVRQADSDRYLTALFAPIERRGDLFALYAFNTEVARSREAVSEPMLGQIRLQWWRDAVTECYESEPRRHQVAEPLALAIRRHALPRALFDRIIDARERDFDDRAPDTLGDLVAYAEESGGCLTQLALGILGVSDEMTQQAGKHVGTAWALTGMMRALPFQLRQGRCPLPRDVMARHSVDERALRGMKPSDAICRAVREISTVALETLANSRSAGPARPRSALPALLPGTLAAAYLARLSRFGHDPFDGRNAEPLRLRSWRLLARALAGRY